jgi:hypothetical protein
MKREFFVWTDRTRLPAIADTATALAAVGFECRAQSKQGNMQDPLHWTSIQLEAEAGGVTYSCAIHVDLPSREQIDQLAEDYEDLPYQVKSASRRYMILAESNEYGQADPFQLQVVAVLARLANGVVEDPQEGGLMMLDEFEEFIASA